MKFSSLLLSATLCASAAMAAEKPKAVILFYTDDLGYHDTSAYGCEKAPCPNLETLASQGLTFTDAHSTHSVCTPSRFSLLTGKYAWRQKNTGILPGDAKMIVPCKTEKMTLPAMMQAAGYKTAAIGKWHLGLGAGKEAIDWNKHISPNANDVGFDYTFIMAATADRVPCVYVRNGDVQGLDPNDPIKVSYRKAFPGEMTGEEHPELLKKWGIPSNKQHADTIIDGISRIGHMQGGTAALWKDQDLADTLTDDAVRFIKESAGTPIFMYFATNDIHVPRDPHARFRGKSGLGIRGDVTVQMDDCLGRLRAALAENGYDDCLFIFSSDNGPVIADGYEDGAKQDCAGHNPAAPYTGGKYTIKEGGTRMPFIVSWPGHVPAGQTSKALFSQIDLGRTLAAIVGVDVPEGSMPDSQAHPAALLGQDLTGGRADLVECGGGRLALRQGDWKFISGPKGGQLYNLAEDIEEKNDVAAQYPEKVAEMKARLDAISADCEK